MGNENKLGIMDALRKVTMEISDWTSDKLSGKVDKINGKSLSTNDYTTIDKNKVANMPNDLIILDGKLFLAQDGSPLIDSEVTLPECCGSSEPITLTNLLDSNILTVAVGQNANLKFSFTSSETNADGTADIYINDVLKMSTPIISGENIIDISSCISDGINNVKLTCVDIYSNSKSLSYSVEMVSLKLFSQFDATIPYEGNITYTYTPVINATKVMHYILDGLEIGTEEVTTSGIQQTYIIPSQPYGPHTFEVYFTVEINGENVESNHLYYNLMFRYNDYIQDDWATIATNIENGTATTLYPIGARKEIPIVLDGVNYTVDVEIIAYNHDDLADGSGKATLTFLCKDLPGFTHKMCEDHTNSYGWSGSDVRAFVNGELYKALPTELKNIIKPVIKISDGGANNKSLVETIDYCWIPSHDEVGFATNRTDTLEGQGTIYVDTFGYGSEGNSTRIKYTSDGYTIGRWWLRSSSYGDSSTLFLRIQNSGGVQPDGLWNSYPVAFGFCVGKRLTNEGLDNAQTAILGTGELGSIILGSGD